MTLREYVGRGKVREFAARIGVSYSYMRRLLSGHETPSAELALRIERETFGHVPASALRPDLFGIVRPAA